MHPRQGKSKLSEDQWRDLIEYYQAGHTLAECGRIWGLTGEYIGNVLKKRGVPRRGRFEPSRPEKVEFAPPHAQVLFKQTEATPAPEGTSHSVQVTHHGRASSRRKIIAIHDSDKKAEMLYEKEVK